LRADAFGRLTSIDVPQKYCVGFTINCGRAKDVEEVKVVMDELRIESK
jgi:hypothetical protein